MTIQTGYFETSKLTRPFYMLSDNFQNTTGLGFLLDKELETSYNITYTKEGEISSVFAAIDENTGLGDKFILYLTVNKNSEPKFNIQISYFLVLFVFYLIYWVDVYEYSKLPVHNGVDSIIIDCRFILEKVNYSVYFNNLISAIKDT